MESSFKRVLIANDLSEMDDSLFSFVNVLSNTINIEKLYLTHIIPNMLVPANAELEFHKMFTSGYPIDEKVRDVLKVKAETFFDNVEFPIDVEVVEGKAYRKLLEILELKEIDLLVVGAKEQSEGSGLTAKRIARKAPCHILFVPSEPPKNLKQILVPVDFSESCARALKTALDLSNENTSVMALHVIKMLQSDVYYGLSMNPKFRQSMLDDAWNAFYDFQTRYEFHNATFEKEIVINDYNNVASEIKTYSKQNDIDLVVMGAQGHTAFENFLYGSVTESLVNMLHTNPVLVVR